MDRVNKTSTARKPAARERKALAWRLLATAAGSILTLLSAALTSLKRRSHLRHCFCCSSGVMLNKSTFSVAYSAYQANTSNED